MTHDLFDRLAALDEIPAPDMIEEVERRSAASGGLHPIGATARRLVLATALALIVLGGSIGAFVWLRAAFDKAPPAEPPSSNYVFSNVRVDASSVDPEGNVLIRFDVAWSGDEDPGIHRCYFTLYGADGQVVSELVREMALDPGKGHGIDGPTPSAPPRSASARCDPQRLDTPAITDVEPLDPSSEGLGLAEARALMERRISAWVERWSVPEMTVEELVANMDAMRHEQARSLEGDERLWALEELLERYLELCRYLPLDHPERQGACGSELPGAVKAS